MSDVRIVFCTFPHAEAARQIGTVLVEKQLVACINLIPAVESIYRWQGQVETAHEVLAILKTREATLPALEQELQTLHPYEVPEILAIDPSHVSPAYQSWLLAAATPPLAT